MPIVSIAIEGRPLRGILGSITPFDHSYFVATDHEGNEFVIGGHPESSEDNPYGDGYIYGAISVEQGRRMEDSVDNRDKRERYIRGHRVLMKGPAADKMWRDMLQAAGGFHRMRLPYAPMGKNCNTVTASIFRALNMKPVYPDQPGNMDNYTGNHRTIPGIKDFVCFATGTPILLADGSTKPIEAIKPGDVIAAYKGDSDLGRGGLVPGMVSEIYRNATDEWVELEWDKDGKSKKLTVTPGHHFLEENGDFRSISSLLEIGGGAARIVLEDGHVAEARGSRIRYSRHSAHLYEEIPANTCSDIAHGWQSYNFEVEELHTYVAGGVRVHNMSKGKVPLPPRLRAPKPKPNTLRREGSAPREEPQLAVKPELEVAPSPNLRAESPPEMNDVRGLSSSLQRVAMNTPRRTMESSVQKRRRVRFGEKQNDPSIHNPMPLNAVSFIPRMNETASADDPKDSSESSGNSKMFSKAKGMLFEDEVDLSDNPFMKKTLNATQQAQLIMTEPEKALRYMRSAGVRNSDPQMRQARHYRDLNLFRSDR